MMLLSMHFAFSDTFDHLKAEFHELQIESMYQLVSIEDSYWQDQESDVGERVCAWNGVQCQEDFIEYIGWEKPLKILINSLSWLPSSLQRLKLINQKVVEPLETRCLPHGLRLMTANFCQIQGSIDLTTLPRRIEDIRLRKNEIAGTVVLANLPRTLKELNLSGNDIRLVVGDKNCLPESIRRVSFISVSRYVKNGHMYHRENKVRYKSLDGSKKDRRIFLKAR